MRSTSLTLILSVEISTARAMAIALARAARTAASPAEGTKLVEAAEEIFDQVDAATATR